MSSVCQDFTSCHCIGQAVWCGQSCSTCLGNEGQDLVSFSIACLAPLPALSLPDVKVFSDSFQLSQERAVSCFSAQLMSELSFVTSPCCRCIGHLYIDRVVKFVKSSWLTIIPPWDVLRALELTGKPCVVWEKVKWRRWQPNRHRAGE